MVLGPGILHHPSRDRAPSPGRQDGSGSLTATAPSCYHRGGVRKPSPRTEATTVGKGNNSQKKEAKKPKKGAKAAPVKAAPPKK